MIDLSHKEKPGKLDIRIRAHREFANFNVEQWIDQFVARKPRRAIFDLGCGNGNHVAIYLKHLAPGGLVAGIDCDEALIEEACRRHGGASIDLRVATMDEKLPFADASFDLCFSNFAIYNAADPAFTLRELKRVMQPGGELVLIGPTINNAREIYEFNKRLTGQAIDKVVLIRTDRLRQEIVPVAAEVFGTVEQEVLHSRLTFPDQDEFLKYFTATELYENGAEKLGKTEADMRAALGRSRDIVLSKEMLAVVARIPA